MERIAMQELESWKNRPGRKPLIVRGARQVGKTWLIKEFGKNEYAQTVYVNFEYSKLLKTLFVDDFDIHRIIAAGSLLGLAFHKRTSFPVGKVEFLNLYPLNFSKFLMALDKQPLLKLLTSRDWTLIKSFKEKYIQLLRQYYYIGGMPEAVLSYSIQNDYKEVRAIQKRILSAYEQDFSKHAPNEIAGL